MSFWRSLRKALLGKRARAMILRDWLEEKGFRRRLVEKLGPEQGAMAWAIVDSIITEMSS